MTKVIHVALNTISPAYV